jgi:hypothetical protein
MSDDNGQHAHLHWQDAFTSPSWQIPELDEAVLAPPLEDFGLTDFRAPRDLPRPPDVDEILRGEYTGWIPVIREGESLEQVQEREQTHISETVAVHVEEVVAQSEAVQQREPMQQPASRTPRLAVETFEYGHPAQHEVSAPPRSTPVVQPTPVAPMQTYVAPQPVAQPAPVSQPTVYAQPTPVEQPEPTQVAPQPVARPAQSDAFNDTFDTSSWSSADASTEQTPSRPTQSIDAKFVDDVTAPADNSLELVIMRDEIQDLRNRLDASQKLVEEMMHKLANLAELALRSRM